MLPASLQVMGAETLIMLEILQPTLGYALKTSKAKGLLEQMLEDVSPHLQAGRIIEENGALGEAFQPGMIATS